jgi:hypothetical protein
MTRVWPLSTLSATSLATPKPSSRRPSTATNDDADGDAIWYTITSAESCAFRRSANSASSGTETTTAPRS